MADFTELIKNFDKIRDYARDFLVYGFKCRNDYTKKSARSYDNERRRIESYLTGYTKWETNPRGKTVFISTETADLSKNPLFSVWETRSFTTNDCLLHFVLCDILQNTPGITASHAANLLHDEYLARFPSYVMPDTMTVRNKLNEYAGIGLFYKQKQGNTVRFYLQANLFDQLSPKLYDKLLPAIHFFENVSPAGILGYFLRRDSQNTSDTFAFRHLYMSHTLDDGILVNITRAITAKQLIQFEIYGRRSHTTSQETVLPLKVAGNVRHGRRYLMAFNLRLRKFFSYRLDNIKKVKVLQPDPAFFDEKALELDNLLPFIWGVALNRRKKLERIEMILSINEETEQYVLARLEREGQNGTIEKVGAHTFLYRAEITDTQEIVPWLRTFIGRIIALTGSNTPAIEQFFADIERMAQMYTDGSQD